MILKFFRDSSGIGTMVIDNPPFNYLKNPVFCCKEELSSFLSAPDLKAAVIKGSGRNFCGGADFEIFREQIGDAKSFSTNLNEGKELLEIIRQAPVPVAACIKGSCLGAGFEIALNCHFRFAADSAMFGFPESDKNIFPGFSGTQAELPVHIRIGMILSGEFIRGEDAYKKGIVHYTAQASGIEKMCYSYLERLVGDKPPYLIHAVMQSIVSSHTMPREQAMLRETDLFIAVAAKSLSE